MKKTGALLIITALILTILGSGAFAADNTSILDRVNQAGGSDSVSQLEQRAADAGESFIKFLRNTAIIISVIMFVIIAYSLLFSPNVNTIADCKGRVGALILAIVMAVMAEEIVGTIMSWVG